GHPQVARGLPAEDLRPEARRPAGIREPGRGRGDDAAPGARRRHLRGDLLRRGGACRAARGEGAEERADRDDHLRPGRPLPHYRRVPGLMTPVLAFDIETIPDCAGIRGLYGLPADLPDADVAELAFQKRRVSSGSDFLPPHLQRIIAIGCVLREGDSVQVFSIAEPERDEPAILRKFFDGIDKYTPQLVSWNGTGFDLPVLNCRTLLCGGCALTTDQYAQECDLLRTSLERQNLPHWREFLSLWKT